MYFDTNISCTSSADQIFAVFDVASFLCMLQLRVPVLELGMTNTKPYRIFESPLILLMIVNNEGNISYLMCKSNFNKSWDMI